MQQNVMYIARTLAAVALAAAVACGGGDKSNAPDNTPATVTANVTTPATAVIFSPINPVPSVIVKNAAGTPLANVRVIFAVTSGGGTVTGPSQLTDASGVAAVDDWTLGSSTGAQTLTATAGGKTATFTVTATNNCTISGALALGSTVTGNLTTATCAAGDGTAAQSWTFQQATGQASVSFVMHSTATPNFDTVILLHRTAFSAFDKLIGVNDDASATTTDSQLNIILGAGNYVVSGNNLYPGETGPFTLGAQAWTGDFVNCEEDYVTTGITTNQTMTGSCHYNTPLTQYIDVAGIYLAAGQVVQIDMTSAAFDPKLDMYLGSTLVASNDNVASGTTAARITYTATQAGIFAIIPTSAALAQSGAYTLSVTNISGGPSSPATISGRGEFPRAWLPGTAGGFSSAAGQVHRAKAPRAH